MEKILIEAKVNPKHVILFRVLAIVYLILFPLAIMFWLIGSGLKNQKLVVTEDNIRGTYGKLFKRNIDLPLDSINSTEVVKRSGIINISTSSQKIHFESLLNAEEISIVINDLIRNRQKKQGATTIIQQSDAADELSKSKNLLDQGVITQEEFDAKKKQLLGL